MLLGESRAQRTWGWDSIHHCFQKCQKLGFEEIWTRSFEKYDELDGNGRAWTAGWSKHHWLLRRWGITQPIVEKMGTKRSLLTDEKRLSLAVDLDGVNYHDAKLLEATLWKASSLIDLR